MRCPGYPVFQRVNSPGTVAPDSPNNPRHHEGSGEQVFKGCLPQPILPGDMPIQEKQQPILKQDQKRYSKHTNHILKQDDVQRVMLGVAKELPGEATEKERPDKFKGNP